jgi:hypothetical protein
MKKRFKEKMSIRAVFKKYTSILPCFTFRYVVIVNAKTQQLPYFKKFAL